MLEHADSARAPRHETPRLALRGDHLAEALLSWCDPQTAPSSSSPNGEKQDWLDRTLAGGLRARVGRLLLPPMVPRPAMALDWAAYRALVELRAEHTLAGWSPVPDAPCVCEGCTLVFWPKAKRYATFCELCAKRQPPSDVLGVTAKWRDRPLRAPRTFGHAIVGWRTFYVRSCSVCGEDFIAKRTTRKTCSGACRQASHRTHMP